MLDEIPNELGFLTPVRKRIKLIGKGASNVVSAGNSIFVSSYFSDGIDVVERIDGDIKFKFVRIGSKDITESKIRYGELLFHDADNCFQQWQSCSSCHPGGGRVDGLNWDLMNDGIGNPKNTKNLLYSHQTPPAMASGIRKDAETGVRAGFKHIQFFDASEEIAQAVDAYLKSLKPVPSPYLLDPELSEATERGEILFQERSCSLCHSGPYFTDMQQYEMGVIGEYDKQNKWDTPSLIELWRTAPYLHDGKYYSLEDVFKLGKHGLMEEITESQISDLAVYLKTL
jgi:cytochrome c peroxidase